jgi:hypothetical protein
MITVDNLLTNINNYGFDKFPDLINKKDLKVLKSLSTSVCLPSFITENQSRLLYKILYDHRLHFKIVEDNIIEILEHNSWSKPFRIIDQIRKIYLSKNLDGETVISIEYTHNTAVRNQLHKFAKAEFGQLSRVSGKALQYNLTEKNIVQLVDILKPYKFEIDQKIQDFYEIIKKYEISETKSNYTFEEILPANLKIHLEKECGPLDSITSDIIFDRSVRYQYFSKKSPKKPENLRENIIAREQPRVWVNSTEYNLSEIFEILQSLNRLPALVVFDLSTPEGNLEKLRNFSESLEKNKILENIGVYFRLENDATGQQFNKIIKDKNYNSPLEQDTQVACIQSGKLPKFFLKDCKWSPKSVIMLGHGMRHTKTAVYSSRCDLIINYTEKESIMENTFNLWRK